MKKIAWLLIFAIVFISVPVYADGVDNASKVYKITFEEIESLMMEHNPTIRTNNNTMENLINNSNSIEDAEDDLEDGIDDLNDIISDMNGAIKELDKSIDIIKGTLNLGMPEMSEETSGTQPTDAPFPDDGLLPDGDYTSYATLQALIAVRGLYSSNIQTLRQNRSALRDQLDRLPNQELELDKAILQVEMGNKSVVWGAQNLYLTYNTLERQKDELEQNLELMDEQLRIMEIQQDMGMITHLDVTGMKNQREQLLLGLEILDNQIDNLKGQFNLMLGQDFDTELTIGDIPEINEDKVRQMDYEEDLKIAKRKSYSLQMQSYDYEIQDNNAELAEDNVRGSDERRAAERDFENATINFEQEHRNVELGFHKLYQEVKDEFRALEMEKKNLEYQQQKYNSINIRYDLGLVSKMEWKQAKSEYNVQVNKVEAAEQDLLLAWTQYEWFLNSMSWDGEA